MINAILRHIELLRDKVPDWAAYPFSIPAVKGLERLEFHPAVTFFVGENGSGKSTLIEAISIKAGFNPEGGTKNFSGSTRPTESELHNYLRLARGARREKWGFFLRAETMFNVFTEGEQKDYSWATLHEKSHGEAFLWVALNKFSDGGLYILDEPESALSPQRQLAFLCRMHQLVRSGSQFIISTHSPILMAYPEARIYMLDQEGIQDVRYEDTEHYAITKAFLQNPGRMIREMFRDIDNESD
ncbi:MAG TPA: AAA family ATPase [Polyangiaceae bacterium]|nr:AAA family ATPase [Polyangiaceae bacterium]